MATFTKHDTLGLVRFDILGRLDSAAVGMIENPFIASVRQCEQNVLVDLAGVPFIGSLGIRLLISAARIVQRTGRMMMLTGVQPQPMEVFETVALSDLIPMVDDAEAARSRPGV